MLSRLTLKLWGQHDQKEGTKKDGYEDVHNLTNIRCQQSVERKSDWIRSIR